MSEGPVSGDRGMRGIRSQRGGEESYEKTNGEENMMKEGLLPRSHSPTGAHRQKKGEGQVGKKKGDMSAGGRNRLQDL